MARWLRWLCVSAFLCSSAPGLAQPGATSLLSRQKLPPRPLRSSHLADYDAELRWPNSAGAPQAGRVNTELMVKRLRDLGTTTYYWLIWHQATDWDDLTAFLPAAAREHIQVWVYLVPPSEGPPHYPASEPFKLDYVRWAEEIARLSLRHPNLTGWVIDDFYANHSVFTPGYVKQMQSKARSLNPQLVFLPLMYFPEITAQFVEDYHEAIDGVVVAYPTDREEIKEARSMLNGEIATRPAQLSCKGNTPSSAGDYVQASVTARVASPERARLHFAECDDFAGPTAGYHFKQLLVNDLVVWEADVAGGAKEWQQIEVDAGAAVRGKQQVKLTFRLFDKKGVGNFGVHWRVKELGADGLRLSASLGQPQKWQVQKRGPFEAGFGASVRSSQRRFHIPFIVMTAAEPTEFRLRHGDPASPERIAQWLQMCLQARHDRECDGVVTYCLEKQQGSQVFPMAQRLFREFR